MKLGIVVDSSCGLSKKEAEKKGWMFLPLYIMFNNKEYREGIDIVPSKFYASIRPEYKIKTSASSIGLVTKLFEKATKKFDHIIVYPLSAGLSSQTNNISAIAKKFNNVHVIQSKGAGVAIAKNCEVIENAASKGKSIEDLISLANDLNNNMYGLVTPEYMDWLVSGGRISPKIAKMAGMLKIVPIINFKDGKLDKHGKGRSFRKTLKKSARFLLKEYGKMDGDWIIYNAGNEEIDSIKEDIENIINKSMDVYDFPPCIGSHVGKGAVAILTYKKA